MLNCNVSLTPHVSTGITIKSMLNTWVTETTFIGSFGGPVASWPVMCIS
jgi:hypothetical protein